MVAQSERYLNIKSTYKVSCYAYINVTIYIQQHSISHVCIIICFFQIQRAKFVNVNDK